MLIDPPYPSYFIIGTRICLQGLVKVCPTDVLALVRVIKYGNVTNATKTRSVTARSTNSCSLKDLRKSRTCVDPKREYVCSSLSNFNSRWAADGGLTSEIVKCLGAVTAGRRSLDRHLL